MLLNHSPRGQGSGGKRKPWIRTTGKDGKPPSWRPADDARGLCSPEDVEAKTRAKGAVKGSTSLRKMGSSTSLSSSVGLRRPPAFGLPVPLRAQSLGYGSVQRSAFTKSLPLEAHESNDAKGVLSNGILLRFYHVLIAHHLGTD